MVKKSKLSKTLLDFFRCHRCGTCCKEIGLPYDPESCFAIAKYFSISPKELISRYYGRLSIDGSEWESDDSKRTPCPFLIVNKNEQETKCAIYSVRPEGCKLYPIRTDFGPGSVNCPAWKIAINKLRKYQKKCE